LLIGTTKDNNKRNISGILNNNSINGYISDNDANAWLHTMNHDDDVERHLIEELDPYGIGLHYTPSSSTPTPTGTVANKKEVKELSATQWHTKLMNHLDSVSIDSMAPGGRHHHGNGSGSAPKAKKRRGNDRDKDNKDDKESGGKDKPLLQHKVLLLCLDRVS
jgi:hypothetical protein